MAHDLRKDGTSVWVSSATAADLDAYERAVIQSATRLRRYSPVDPQGLAALLLRQGVDHRTLLIHAKHPIGHHDLVGKVNITNVIRGRGRMATMGYDAFDPYAGKGLFREGLRLAVDLAFADVPHGMGLHRVEANVQPRNVRSAGLLRSLGFVHEGFASRYLYLPDADGDEQWRDHDRYAVRAEDWPAAPYRVESRRRVIALVNGAPGSGKTTLARALSARLGVPLFSKDVIKESVAEALGPSVYNAGPVEGRSASALGAGASMTMWELLKYAPHGAIVESRLPASDERFVREGLASARFRPEDVPEVWCEVPLALARQRYEDRAYDGLRHPVHGPQSGLEGLWEALRGQNEPLGIGPVLRVDTSEPLDERRLTDITLQIRGWCS